MGYSSAMFDEIGKLELPSKTVLDVGAQDVSVPSTSELDSLNQFIHKHNPRGELLSIDKFPVMIEAREVYARAGYEYTCINVDERPGTLRVDLARFEIPRPRGKYGLGVNVGTTEHLASPAATFALMHEMCADRGVMYNDVPLFGLGNHGLMNPTPKFWHALIWMNQYKVEDVRTRATSPTVSSAGNFFHSYLSYMKGLEAITSDSHLITAILRKGGTATFVVPYDVVLQNKEEGRAIAKILVGSYWPFLATGGYTEMEVVESINAFVKYTGEPFRISRLSDLERGGTNLATVANSALIKTRGFIRRLVTGSKPPDVEHGGTLAPVPTEVGQQEPRATLATPNKTITPASELDVYKHAFLTTANDRDIWKRRYLWLEWNCSNPLPQNWDLGPMECTRKQVDETQRFLRESNLELLHGRGSMAHGDEKPITVNAILIGAEKSGTSHFYSCVREHHHVYTGEKDRDLFRLLQGKDRAFDELILGDRRSESTTVVFDAGFMLNAESAYTLKRRSGGDLKLIVALLRDPVARAISEYRMRLRQGFEYLSFSDAIKQGSVRRQAFPGDWEHRWAYLERGLYWTQLKPYVEQFGAERLMVRLFEDSVVDNSRRLCHEFFARLNLDMPTSESFESLLNKGGKESPSSVKVTETQRRMGVTDGDMEEWLNYFPSGETLEWLRSYYRSDARLISDNFGLRTDQFWSSQH